MASQKLMSQKLMFFKKLNNFQITPIGDFPLCRPLVLLWGRAPVGQEQKSKVQTCQNFWSKPHQTKYLKSRFVSWGWIRRAPISSANVGFSKIQVAETYFMIIKVTTLCWKYRGTLNADQNNHIFFTGILCLRGWMATALKPWPLQTYFSITELRASYLRFLSN